MTFGSKSLFGFIGLLLATSLAGSAASEPCPSGTFVPVQLLIRPENPCAGRDVELVILSCGPCVRLVGLEGPDSLRVRARMRPFLCMPAVCFQDTLVVRLGPLAAGTQTLNVRVIGEVVHPDSSVCIAERTETLTFTVGSACGPQGPLPYLDQVEIGTQVICVRAPCPPLACPFVFIPVGLRGHFDTDCIGLQRVEVLPRRAYPAPPFVRIVYGQNDCSLRPCIDGTFPWSTRLAIPELPPGDYVLPVEAVLVHSTCGDSLVETLGSTGVPFTVVQECPPLPSPSCFTAEWHGAFDGNPCEALVAPDRKAQVILELSPGVALAGLQGEFALDSLALEITDLKPVGPAAGMHLGWRPTPRGAQFVMFAEQGSPIPPFLMECIHCGWPVLQVTLGPRAGVPLPPVTHLVARGLLASDSLGNAVPECPSLFARPFLEMAASICADQPCDFNGDGSQDVRDLVLMVHCILGVGGCPDPKPSDLDCNHDGTLGVDDVLCCARTVLSGGSQDTIPGRPEPGVRVSMGQPQAGGERVEVPIALEGAALLGAARLAIEYPADRYDLEGADLDGAPAEWLSLHEQQGNQAIVGLIGLSAAGRSDLTLRLRLKLKPGMPSGGQVRLARGQFAGPDGAALDVTTGPSVRSLGSVERVSLAVPQPNPFSRSTRFAVTVAQACRLEVGIYDLAGREVRQIHRGWTPAGTLTLEWDGRSADGGRARAGLYFVRAAGAGETRVRRLALVSAP